MFLNLNQMFYTVCVGRAPADEK